MAEEDVKVHAGVIELGAVAPAVVVAAAVAEQPKQEREDVKPRADDGNVRFTVPLTAMFKRSSSAPAPRARVALVLPHVVLALRAGPRARNPRARVDRHQVRAS